MKKASRPAGAGHPTASEREAIRARIRADIDSTSDAADAAVTAAALEDADNPPNRVLKRRGRPPAAVVKEKVPLRLDRDVLAYFRATGDGWQTRINSALRKAAGLKP